MLMADVLVSYDGSSATYAVGAEGEGRREGGREMYLDVQDSEHEDDTDCKLSTRCELEFPEGRER